MRADSYEFDPDGLPYGVEDKQQFHLAQYSVRDPSAKAIDWHEVAQLRPAEDVPTLDPASVRQAHISDTWDQLAGTLTFPWLSVKMDRVRQLRVMRATDVFRRATELFRDGRFITPKSLTVYRDLERDAPSEEQSTFIVFPLRGSTWEVTYPLDSEGYFQMRSIFGVSPRFTLQVAPPSDHVFLLHDNDNRCQYSELDLSSSSRHGQERRVLYSAAGWMRAFMRENDHRHLIPKPPDSLGGPE